MLSGLIWFIGGRDIGINWELGNGCDCDVTGQRGRGRKGHARIQKIADNLVTSLAVRKVKFSILVVERWARS